MTAVNVDLRVSCLCACAGLVHVHLCGSRGQRATLWGFVLAGLDFSEKYARGARMPCVLTSTAANFTRLRKLPDLAPANTFPGPITRMQLAAQRVAKHSSRKCVFGVTEARLLFLAKRIALPALRNGFKSYCYAQISVSCWLDDSRSNPRTSLSRRFGKGIFGKATSGASAWKRTPLSRCCCS